MKEILGGLMMLVGFIGVATGLSFAGYESYRYFAPRYTAVDSAVFHESIQYNEGMVRELEKLQLDYMGATPDQKQTLKAVIFHKFSVYPQDRLPADLRNFYTQLQAGAL